MIGIAETHVDVVLKPYVVLHDGQADAAVDSPNGHVARQQEGLRRYLIPVGIDKASPLLAV